MMKEIPPVALKKRRRENNSTKEDPTTTNRNPPVNLVPHDIWLFEEQEVERRDAEKDLLLYKQTCDEIRKLMKEILELKTKKKSEAEIAERRIQASLLFISLKKLNRLEKLKSKKCRDATNEAKHRVDTFQLQLQNLLYESLHLKKEVDKCVEFKSKDEEIELVSVEEFYREAPAKLSKPEDTKRDKHQLMLARLHWELEQRKQLADKCEQACILKEKIISEIKQKREHLDDLAPRLNNILQATRPVQDCLDMPFNAQRLENKTARLLPRPLFILHVQSSAYHEACDKNMSVTIEGDCDEARAVKDAGLDQDDDSGDSDMEESTASKRHRRRNVDRLAISRKKLLQKHPLSVVITIKCQGNNSLILRFTYLMSLHIATVTCTLKVQDPIPEGAAGDMLNLESLLACLVPGDFGDQTPNFTNHYQLQKLGMKEFSYYISELGHPYRWVQTLCGLEFPLEDDKHLESLHSTVKCDHSVCANHIAKTVNAIRQRLEARLCLQQQVSSLTRGIVPANPMSGNFPTKVTSRLVSWKSINWEEFTNDKQRAKLVENGMLSSRNILFAAQIERGSAKLRAQVCVSPDYPATIPLFNLNITWKHERDAHDETLRVMEREVNVFCSKSDKPQDANYLLTSQVQQLLMCFDVYLETSSTNSAFEGPVEFPKEKIFIRAHCGRDRSKPYKYVPKYGYFMHR